MAAIGLSSESLRDGLLQGLIWSGGFGIVVLAGFVILFYIGIDPFTLVRTHLPAEILNPDRVHPGGWLHQPCGGRSVFPGSRFRLFSTLGILAGFICQHGWLYCRPPFR